MKYRLLSDDDLPLILARMDLRVVSRESAVPYNALRNYKYQERLSHENRELLSQYLRLVAIHLNASIERGKLIDEPDYIIPDDYEGT